MDLRRVRERLLLGQAGRARAEVVGEPPSAARSAVLLACALDERLPEEAARHARDVEWLARADDAQALLPLLVDTAERIGRTDRTTAARLYALALECGRDAADDVRVDLVRALKRLREQEASVPVGPFLLEALVGTGSMGQVWRATHGAAGFTVALKVLAGSTRAVEAEIAAVARLDHPNICWLYDCGVVGPATEAMAPGVRAGQAWLASEWAPHGTLEERQGTLPWGALQRVLLLLLDALAHAHARGVLHLDVKPANVLLGGDRHTLVPKLADFGIARRMGDGRRRVAGTPAFMAPEQFVGDGRGLGPWTDLYAFGGLVYALVCGDPPYGLGDVHALRSAHEVTRPPPLAPRMAVPAGLEAFVHRLLAKAPEDRFACAAEAAADLFALPDADRGGDAGPALRPSELPTLLLDASEEVGRTPLPTTRAALPVPARFETPEVPFRRGVVIDASLGLLPLRLPRFEGRMRERAVLWACLRACRERARAVAIVGPDGSGRSRLGAWLVERALELGVADAFVVPPGPGGLRSAAVRSLGVGGLVGDALRAAVIARVAAEGADAFETDAWVRWLLSPGSPDGTALRLVTRRITRRARARPQIVWFDDAERTPGAMALADEVAGGPLAAVVVLGLCEPSADAAAREGREGWAVVRLGRMPSAAMALLLTGVVPLAQELLVRVGAASEGQPGHAVRIVRDLAARGLLERTASGTWTASASVSVGAIAADAARVESVCAALGPDHRRVAVLAAALGGPVDERVLADAALRLGWSDPSMALGRLVRAGLLAEGRFPVWAVGALASEAAPALHRAAADALEAAEGRTLRVARHRLRAREPGAVADVQEFSLKFVQDHALDGAALLDEVQRALEDGRVAESDPRYVCHCLDRAAHANAAGDTAEVEAWLSRARGRAGGRLAYRAAQLEAVLKLRRGDHDGAVAEFERALEVAAEHGTPLTERLHTHASLASIARRAGRSAEAVARCRSILDGVAGMDDPPRRLIASVWYTLGLASLVMDRIDDAEAAVRGALDALGDLPDPDLRAFVSGMRAQILDARGRLAEAEQAYVETITLFAIAGQRSTAMWLNLALARARVGRFSEALEAVHAMLAEPGEPQVEAAFIGRVLLLAEVADAGNAAWDQRVGRLGDPNVVGPYVRSLAAAVELTAAEIEARGRPDRAAALRAILARGASRG